MEYTDEKVRQLLAKNIKKFREQNQYSQEYLADKAKISVPYLSSIECGKKWPYPATLGKLADALNISLYELFSEGNKLPESSDKYYIANTIKQILEAQNNAIQDVCKEIFNIN